MARLFCDRTASVSHLQQSLKCLLGLAYEHSHSQLGTQSAVAVSLHGLQSRYFTYKSADALTYCSTESELIWNFVLTEFFRQSSLKLVCNSLPMCLVTAPQVNPLVLASHLAARNFFCCVLSVQPTACVKYSHCHSCKVSLLHGCRLPKIHKLALVNWMLNYATKKGGVIFLITFFSDNMHAWEQLQQNMRHAS